MSPGKMRWRVRERDAAALDEVDARAGRAYAGGFGETARSAMNWARSCRRLREQETIRAAVLQRMAVERNSLDEEERRVEGRRKELDQRLAQAVADLAREQETLARHGGRDCPPRRGRHRAQGGAGQ